MLRLIKQEFFAFLSLSGLSAANMYLQIINYSSGAIFVDFNRPKHNCFFKF